MTVSIHQHSRAGYRYISYKNNHLLDNTREQWYPSCAGKDVHGGHTTCALESKPRSTFRKRPKDLGIACIKIRHARYCKLLTLLAWQWSNKYLQLSTRTIKDENSASMNVALEPLYIHQEVVVSFVKSTMYLVNQLELHTSVVWSRTDATSKVLQVDSNTQIMRTYEEIKCSCHARRWGLTWPALPRRCCGLLGEEVRPELSLLKSIDYRSD